MFPPCCCSTPECLQYEDTFNRSNNSDINVGAPFTWATTGTTSIASNRLAVSSNSSAIMTDAGAGTIGQRMMSVVGRGANNDRLRIYCGDHYVEIRVGGGGSIGIYESDGTLVSFRAIGTTFAANTDYTITVAYGPVQHSSSSEMAFNGISVVATGAVSWSVPCDVSGNEFGIGAGATASVVSYNTFQLHQNSIIRTSGTSSCLSQTIDNCWPIGPIGISQDWNTVAGSWLYATGVMTAEVNGRTEFIGKIPYDDNVYLNVRLNETTIDGISNGFEWVAWADYSTTTGIRAVLASGSWDIDIIVNGSTVDTISAAVIGSNILRVAAWIYKGIFSYQIHNDTTTTLIQEDEHPFTASGAQCIPSLELVDIQLMSNPDWNVSGGSAHSPGPTVRCIRGPLDDSPWCTGTVPDYDVLIDDVDGDAGDIVNVNGVALRADTGSDGVKTTAGSVDIGGSNRLYSTSVSWHRDGSDRILSVWVQFNNAWALFEKTYSSAITCNSLSSEPIALVDYHNDAFFDMSAATCEIDSV